MNPLQKWLTLLLLFVTMVIHGQEKNLPKIIVDSANLIFKDTLFNIVFDSVSHDLGMIKPIHENSSLVKHFKYIGKDTIVITRTWTGDPHFICEYPREALIPNKIYSIKICFWHEGKQGKMHKSMGFGLSDGNRVVLRFLGDYLPIDEDQN